MFNLTMSAAGKSDPRFYQLPVHTRVKWRGLHGEITRAIRYAKEGYTTTYEYDVTLNSGYVATGVSDFVLLPFLSSFKIVD
jgi:hypothetical protein